MSVKPSIFTRHSRVWQRNHYVYPVISRRAKGLSVGVNLNPDKGCNFDCIYCCVDRTKPPVVREVDLKVLRAELDDMLRLAVGGELWAQPPLDSTPEGYRRLNDIAFSGDGEPTGFAEFPQACEMAAELLAKHGQAAAKIVVITNGTLLHRPKVASALEFLDAHNGEIWAKLDAGTDEYYRRVERTKVPFARVLENILVAGRKRPIVIQSMFMMIDGQGPTEAETGAYVERLRELAVGGCLVKQVQVYTVARATAEAFVAPLPDGALDAIAARVRALRLNVETYYGAS